MSLTIRQHVQYYERKKVKNSPHSAQIVELRTNIHSLFYILFEYSLMPARSGQTLSILPESRTYSS